MSQGESGITPRRWLPRQIMWAVLIGLISVGPAILVNH